MRKDPRADGDELRDWLLRAGQMTDLFGGDWRRMCVVLDEAVRPDWLVAALDDVHSCRMPDLEGGPDLERADDAGRASARSSSGRRLSS